MAILEIACGGNVVLEQSVSGAGGAGAAGNTGAGGIGTSAGGTAPFSATAAGTTGHGATGVGTAPFSASAAGTGGFGAGGVGGTGVSVSTTSGSTGSGGTLGCQASVAPPSARIGLDADGGLSLLGGFATYGGTAAPTLSTAGGSLVITENAAANAGFAQYVGAVLYFDGNATGTDCVDAGAYSGVAFDISGSVSGCTIQFSIDDGEHGDPSADMRASGPVGSYAPELTLQVTPSTQAVTVPFAGTGAPTGGSPATAIDPRKLTSLVWQFSIPPSGAASCVSTLTITNISFY